MTVHGGDIRVEFLGTVSDAPLAQLRHAALLDAIGNGTYVHVSDRLPRVIARLRSEQPNRFSRKLAATISDASKSKFTEARPAVIWVHVDYIGTRHFEYLAHSEDGNSFLDAIALATFRSSKREHITQLAFSGGAHPIISSGNVISSFKQVVYDAPSDQFNAPVLLPSGKRQSTRRTTPVAKHPTSLFRVIDKPLPSPVPIAAYDDLLGRLASASEVPPKELIATTLVDKANALASLGRTEEAIAVCDEILTRYKPAAEPMLQEVVASALIAKGVALGHSGSAIKVYDEILDRFGTSPDQPMRAMLANALFNKGNTLGAISDRKNEAARVYDEVVLRFGDATWMRV